MKTIISRVYEVLKYREMLNNLVVKELKGRYKASVLGFFWSLMNPILMTIVYTLVFSTIIRMGIDKFPIFFMANILPWNFFQMSLSVSSMCIVNNSSLVKKIYFPREILPISIVLSNFINFLLSLIVFFFAAMIFKVKITYAVITLPIVFIIQILLVLGLCFFLSCMTVYFRDIEHLIGILLYMWFYVTPIIYPLSLVPKQYLNIFYMNPMTTIIESYNDILYKGVLPNFSSLSITLVVSVVIFLFGYLFFLSKQGKFAEEV